MLIDTNEKERERNAQHCSEESRGRKTTATGINKERENMVATAGTIATQRKKQREMKHTCQGSTPKIPRHPSGGGARAIESAGGQLTWC